MNQLHQKNNFRRFCFFILMVLCVVLPVHKVAHALFVSKTRLIIENNQNFTELIIFNKGDTTKRVTFGWKRSVVKTDGGFRRVKEGEVVPGYRPADPYLQYSPRRVILKARDYQRIKIYVRRPADMEEGEYHSHFTIVAEPEREEEEIKQVDGRIIGKVLINAGMSIPVFLRQGKTSVDVSIQEAYIHKKDNKDYLHVKVSNNSSRSTYGLITLMCSVGGQDARKQVTALRLYTETQQLEVDTPINETPLATDAKTGQIIDGFSIRKCEGVEMTLTDKEDFELKNQILSRAPVSLR